MVLLPSIPGDCLPGKCLAGGTFRRCGVDTLWYVTGTNTRYQLHHRPLEDGEEVSFHLNELISLLPTYIKIDIETDKSGLFQPSLTR